MCQFQIYIFIDTSVTGRDVVISSRYLFLHVLLNLFCVCVCVISFADIRCPQFSVYYEYKPEVCILKTNKYTLIILLMYFIVLW